MKESKKSAVVIGAGPAGLTAGLELAKTKNFNVTLIEKDAVVGGISKTFEFKKCFFDIGPHHFITDSAKILAWWQDIMHGDFHKHKRYTRIYYKKHFFNYPLQPLNVVRGLSIKECVQSVFSYIRIRFFPIKDVCSFQDWVTNKFGSRLFSIFFKTYTEKVWGISCQELSADWSAQRIKGFSLSKAIFYAFFGRFFKKNKPRTLSDVFYYPSLGAGVLWENVAARIASYEGTSLYLNSPIVSIEHDEAKIVAVYSKEHNPSGGAAVLKRHAADYFFSTMPLRDLILAFDPLPAVEVVQAAQALRYRGLVTINLIVNKSYVSPDHWLYIHEKEVRMGRVGNMNNFSLKMVDNSDKHTALCLEYFSFIDEEFWHKTDYELVELGKKELEKIGLVKAAAVLDGMVVRTPDAYPMYVGSYKDHLGTVLNYLGRFSNLQLMGRNGLHSYNNMDTAMLTAMDAVDTVLVQEHVKMQKKMSGTDVFLT
jgi:protoporphyrinogen oxidase